MADRARAVLNGRFPPGTRVKLVRVADESARRPSAADEVVDTQTVDDDGNLEFSKGVKEGERYFAVGHLYGFPREVRLTGRKGDDAQTGVAPVQRDRVRLSDGSWLDERPEREEVEGPEAAPHLAQRQVPEGQVQRSDTPRGTAHPFDPEEPAPYARQEDVDDDEVQASSTPTGRAARIRVGPQSQQDVPEGTLQRSDTPLGVATPIPTSGAVQAQIDKESSISKELRGEPVRAAAEPIEDAMPVEGASAEDSRERQEEMVQAVKDAYEDVAADEDAESALDVESTPVPAAAHSEETRESAEKAADKKNKKEKD